MTGPLARRREVRGLLVARLVLALGGGALLVADQPTRGHFAVAGMLAVLALAASFPVPWSSFRSLQAPIEAVLACLLMLTVEPLPEALLPYLIAPALAAGLLAGTRVAVTTTGLAAATLLMGRLLGDETLRLTPYLGSVSRWTLIVLAVGLLGAWVHRLQSSAAPEDAAYASAYRLISQLRLVARQLSVGLDPVSLGQHLLGLLREQVPFERAGVYVPSNGGRLSPIAFSGAYRLDWKVDQAMFDEAWASGAPVYGAHPLSTDVGPGYSCVLPLRLGPRTVGLVAVERADPPFDPAGTTAVERLLEEQGLRLETALLFSEVRSLATAEERRRLAREIHDGIAQELASLGYVVDDLASRAKFLPDLEKDIRGLRGELTRVISELRLSIFDLRSEVEPSRGLGTALSDYVQQVGAGSTMTVHLELDESPVRLSVDAETEMLRIVQEAVTNARKHANAANLWVTCRVNPPSALLRVEDDGDGLGQPRNDSFGLEVMRERAARIGAGLTVKNRQHGGTVVEVTLGQVPSQTRVMP